MVKKKRGAIKRKSIMDTSIPAAAVTSSSTLKKRKRAMDDEGVASTNGDAEDEGEGDDDDGHTFTRSSWRSKAVTKLSDFPRNMVKCELV